MKKEMTKEQIIDYLKKGLKEADSSNSPYREAMTYGLVKGLLTYLGELEEVSK